MLNHIRMGNLAGWRQRGQHERVRESYVVNFVPILNKRGDRDLPYCLSACRKESIRHLGYRVFGYLLLVRCVGSSG